MKSLTALQSEHAKVREHVEALALQKEIEAMQSAIGMFTMSGLLQEGILRPGDPILTQSQIQKEIGFGTGGGYYSSLPDDYYLGRCRPFYENEGQHQQIRGIGRLLAGSDEMAACVLRNLRNYTIGEGYKVTVSPRKGKGGEAYAPIVQEFVDEFLEQTQLTNEGESDALLSTVIDGDYLVWLKPRGGEVPTIQFVGGEHITEPANPRRVENYEGLPELCWSFGVATDHVDYTQVAGYFCDWYGKGEVWDFIPATDAVFIKRNVPRVCKRGISDFYIPFRSIERGGKLMSNIADQAAIQASIAYIKSAASGATQSDLESSLRNKLLNAPVNVTRFDGSTAQVTGESILGGRIVNTAGTEFKYGPMGTPQGPLFVDIYQAIARRVGTRWCFPEFMITGDASNNNRASSETAESPMIQSIVMEQGFLADKEQELVWKAVAMAAKHGRFGGAQFDELYATLSIIAEAPDPVSRDPLKQEQVFNSQQAAGILSKKTRAAKSNLDFEDEIANGAMEAPSGLLDLDPASGSFVSQGAKGTGQQGQVPGLAQKVFEDYQRQQAAYVEALEEQSNYEESLGKLRQSMKSLKGAAAKVAMEGIQK